MITGFVQCLQFSIVLKLRVNKHGVTSSLPTCVRIVCTGPPSISTAAGPLKPFLPEKLHLPKWLSQCRPLLWLNLWPEFSSRAAGQKRSGAGRGGGTMELLKESWELESCWPRSPWMEDVRCREDSRPASILLSDWLSRANGRGWGWWGQLWVGPAELSVPETQDQP